jgi:hypothetical protein
VVTRAGRLVAAGGHEESAVRTVVLCELLSLDGVAEQPGHCLADCWREVVDNLGRIIGGHPRQVVVPNDGAER